MPLYPLPQPMDPDEEDQVPLPVSVIGAPDVPRGIPLAPIPDALPPPKSQIDQGIRDWMARQRQDNLGEAQRIDARSKALGALGDQFNAARDMIVGGAIRSQAPDRSVEAAKNVEEMQKAQDADKAEAAALAQAKEEKDPNSDTNVKARAAMRATAKGRELADAMGPAFATATASQLARFFAGPKDVLESSDKAAHEAGENTRESQKLAGEKAKYEAEIQKAVREGDLNRANAIYLERLKLQGQKDLEKQKEAKDKAPKPIPEQETTKVVNQVEALKAIDKLQAAHKKVGFSGVLPAWGDTAKSEYVDAINALAGPIAAGALPAARETPALMEEFKKGFPAPIGSDDRAAAYFDHLRDAVRSNAAGQISAVKAGGYMPEQVANLEKQWSDANAGRKPAAPITRTVDGVTKTWDPDRKAWVP